MCAPRERLGWRIVKRVPGSSESEHLPHSLAPGESLRAKAGMFVHS